jgi:octaprenyl-diphosphate synthase
VMQLAATARGEASRERYRAVIEAKTAALFRAACEAGALTATQDPSAVAAFATFGLETGLAFQLVDDALDYGGATGLLGKAVGDDFREGKATLPVLIALERADTAGRAFWDRMLRKETGPDDLTEALALIARTDAVAATLDQARTHTRAACAALAAVADALPEADTQTLAILDGLAEQIVTRAS